MKLNAHFKFYHLNSRVERHGEEETKLAVDVDVKGEIGIKSLDGVYSTPTSFGMLEGLYTKGGNLVTSDIKQIDLAAEGIEGKGELRSAQDGAVPFRDAKLTRIKIKPKENRVADFTARLQFNPTPAEFSKLGELLDKAVKVKYAGQLELNSEEDEDAEQPGLDLPDGSEDLETEGARAH